MVQFWNTLSRKKEEFKPIKPNAVGTYTCGPTVYYYAHIGNMRAYVFADILQRFLKTAGHDVKWVMNITDVDDKTIRDSKEKYPNSDPLEALLKFTKEYEELFYQDLKKLNIELSDFFKLPKATEHIKEMQEIIASLYKKGIAYESEGSIYFSIHRYQESGHKYGVLSKLDLSQLKSTERIKKDEYEKDNIQDFALWKKSEAGEPAWDFELDGKNHTGRPGWHIECSAMSTKYLDQPFDIHTGGVDHIFPHHEDEIAQSAGAYDKPLANYFLHEEFLHVEGKKMSKSLGNLFTLKDLVERGSDPLALRHLFLTAHYRAKLNFTWESLAASEKALNGLSSFIARLRNSADGAIEVGGDMIKKHEEEFFDALSDDLDTPKALALLNVMINHINKTGVSNISKESKDKIIGLIQKFDDVLGLKLFERAESDIPKDIFTLLEKREDFRNNKAFDKADKIRDEILGKGYLIEDTSAGPVVLKK